MVRGFGIAVLALLAGFQAGCDEPENDMPLWEQVKVGDLAPAKNGKRVGPRALNTINFDVHIYEIPAEDANELEKVRGLLETGRVRYYNYGAFEANLFSVRVGRIGSLGRLNSVLVATGGHKLAKVSVLVENEQEQDVLIRGVGPRQEVIHVSAEAVRQEEVVGPGALVLRIMAGKTPKTRELCSVIAYPVFTTGLTAAIPELAARAKAEEVSFKGAGFGLRMSPGDMVLLGPAKHVSDMTTLPGLFFSNPEGSLFFSGGIRSGPERKAAVRVYVLVCTWISN
jgi:hypothetical protein